MKYTLTKDLETGNTLIDTEHRELFAAVNDLMDACSQGKGRDQIAKTATFLTNYVAKHFRDEERLQQQSKYPAYTAHKQFHEKYKRDLAAVATQINSEGPTIAALGKLNQTIGVLVNHIRIEDKKLASHVKANA